jgi:hypothetical protein
MYCPSDGPGLGFYREISEEGSLQNYQYGEYNCGNPGETASINEEPTGEGRVTIRG